MATIIIPGLNYLGDMPDQTKLVPNCGFPNTSVSNRKFNIYPLPEEAPGLLNNAIQPPHTRKVLGKSNPNSKIVLNSPPVSSLHGMYPKTGIFRHQEKGLAYHNIPNKEIDGPIMPISDSRFPWLTSKLSRHVK